MRIIQVCPAIETGRGVEAVAHHLEQEWQRLGIPTERFTLAEAGAGFLPQPGPGLRGKLTLIARVLWFTGPGTFAARRRWGHPDADTVVVCHNDALVGDVYVNHGIVAVAMKARGQARWRMLRNPLHLFTFARDKARFASATHRYVVNLTSREDADLRATYGRVRPETVVISNGVDVERYRPDATHRELIRGQLGLDDSAVVGVFVGHEFDRKGLPPAVEALRELPAHVHLLVVGGTDDLVEKSRADAERLGVRGRVHHVGAQADPRPYLNAADVLVFPSAYESYGLVVTEAMACGLPVIATPTGCVPDLVEEGHTGFVTDGSPRDVARAWAGFLGADRDALRRHARATAEQHSWASVARQYLALFERVLEERAA